MILNKKNISYSFQAFIGIVLVSLFAISCGTIQQAKQHINNALESTGQNIASDLITKGCVGIDTTSNIQNLTWRQFFSDTKLQILIDTALSRNTDLKQCRMRVEEMETALKVAKLSFFPSLFFSPTGSWNKFDGNIVKSYDVPLTAQWQIDVFGSLYNKKRSAQSAVEQSKDIVQAVQVQLISNVASLYYQLLMLDKEKQILASTAVVWKEGVETQRALMEAGQGTSAAVGQLEASYYNVQTQQKDVETQISQLENALCLLLAETPHSIDRSSLETFVYPSQIGVGVPLALLNNRPDVRAVSRDIETAYFANKEAFSNMFPNITLSGTAGWSNGEGIVNPGKILLNVVAGLTQPIFAHGSLIAQRKITKLKLEESKQLFIQSVLNAGNEVNNALIVCQSAKDKSVLLRKQIESLTSAYNATRELMNHGSTTYLEVLTAQESLLSAQLGDVANTYNGIQGLIDLYIALGGGY